MSDARTLQQKLIDAGLVIREQSSAEKALELTRRIDRDSKSDRVDVEFVSRLSHTTNER